MAGTPLSDQRGNELANELNNTLNEEFPEPIDYRDAVESVLSFFETVILGLDEDERRAEREDN